MTSRGWSKFFFVCLFSSYNHLVVSSENKDIFYLPQAVCYQKAPLHKIRNSSKKVESDLNFSSKPHKEVQITFDISHSYSRTWSNWTLGFLLRFVHPAECAASPSRCLCLAPIQPLKFSFRHPHLSENWGLMGGVVCVCELAAVLGWRGQTLHGNKANFACKLTIYFAIIRSVHWDVCVWELSRAYRQNYWAAEEGMPKMNSTWSTLQVAFDISFFLNITEKINLFKN